MYLARFPYDVLPVNRERAIDFIRREVEAAHRDGLTARLRAAKAERRCSSRSS